LERLPFALHTHEYHSYIDSKLESIKENLSKVQSTNQKLSETFEKVKSQLTDNRRSLESMIFDQISDKAESPSKSPSISEDSVAQIGFSLASEQKEKEKPQLNVIIYHLEESSALDGPSRKQDDIKKCMSFLQTHLQVSATITNAFRLGKKSTKPRLFKIPLNNLEEKIAILKNKIKLRSTANPENVRKLYITPDFTPLSRKRIRL